MKRSNAFPQNTLAKNKRQKFVKCRLMQIPIVRRAVLLVWGALAALVALGLRAESVAGLVTVAVAVDTALLAVLTVASLRITREREPAAADREGAAQ